MCDCNNPDTYEDPKCLAECTTKEFEQGGKMQQAETTAAKTSIIPKELMIVAVIIMLIGALNWIVFGARNWSDMPARDLLGNWSGMPWTQGTGMKIAQGGVYTLVFLASVAVAVGYFTTL